MEKNKTSSKFVRFAPLLIPKFAIEYFAKVYCGIAASSLNNLSNRYWKPYILKTFSLLS